MSGATSDRSGPAPGDDLAEPEEVTILGRRVDAHPPIPWGALIWLLIGVGLASAAPLLGHSGWAVGAALPLAVGFALLATRPKAFSATFSATGIEVEEPHPPRSIPYTSLRTISASSKRAEKVGKNFPIHVGYEGGHLDIPASIDLPSSEVFGFLLGQFPRPNSREVHPHLADYLARQDAEHGPVRVWTFRAAPKPKVKSPRMRLRLVSLAALAVGLGWCIYGSADPQTHAGWMGVGAMLAFYGVLLFLISFASHSHAARRTIRRWQDSSLIVAPVGLAMVQGDVKGVVGWNELLDVKVHTRARSFRVSRLDNLPGIYLSVKGAKIFIADIYDVPLPIIGRRINVLWREAREGGSTI